MYNCLFTPDETQQMVNRNKQTISTLNELIHTCKDRQEALRIAMDKANDRQLKALFRFYGKQRGRLLEELRTQICGLGSEQKPSDTSRSSSPRIWTKSQTALSGKGDEALVAQCERDEESAEQKYKGALKKPLPA